MTIRDNIQPDYLFGECELMMDCNTANVSNVK